MNERLEHLEHENTHQKNNSDRQDELSHVLKDERETMKEAIKELVSLAQYYYDNEWSVDYGEYTWEEVQVGHDAHLYTLITYKGKDVLVQVGSWEYNLATFTKSGIEKTRRLRNSPLPLFVVTARADQEQKNNHPRRFLNEHAMIYVPKWGLAETRMTHKERQKSIDYGKSNGIVEYEKAKTTMQSALLKKMFFDRKTKNNINTYVIGEIEKLKNKSFDEFVKRYEVNPKFYKQDTTSVAFRECLMYIGQGKLLTTYDLIQCFDLQSGTFTPTKSLNGYSP